MTEGSSLATTHLSVAMTTSQFDEALTTDINKVTSPLIYGMDFYFKCAVVIIGLVGTVANALVLYAMVVCGQHKKCLLIFNQNLMDLCSCLLLAITYVLHLCRFYLSGTSGYWLCLAVFSDFLPSCPINGSIINLAGLTVDRYLKVEKTTLCIFHNCESEFMPLVFFK